jgi:D-alanyl-D-alanine carboxypeptidase
MFINEMNRTAREFNMRYTQFANPHGLANNFNRSCSNDLARLTSQAMNKNYFFRQIVSCKNYKCNIK